MHATRKHQRNTSDFALIAIGIFKLIKTALLIALGVILIRWRNEDLGAAASRWIGNLWLGRSSVDALLTRLSLMSRETIDRFTIGSFTYAVLLSIEGIGLCRRKRWAEYLTVGITASLLPFEFYELAHRITVSGIVITLANIAILIYLVARLRK